MICALVCPDEGYVRFLFVADSKANLIAEIVSLYDLEAEADNAKGHFEDAEYVQQEKQALLQMIDSVEFVPGSYKIAAIEPHWKVWGLLIAEERGSFSASLKKHG